MPSIVVRPNASYSDGTSPTSMIFLTGAISLQAAAADVWPNVMISVAEMQVPNVLSGGLAGAFTANTGGVVNGVGGIVALFGVLIVLYTFVQRVLRLNSVKVKGDTRKPHKSKRKATAVRSEQNRFRIIQKEPERLPVHKRKYSLPPEILQGDS